MKKLLSVLFLLVALGFFSFRLASYRNVEAQSNGTLGQTWKAGTPVAEGFSPQQVVPPFKPIVDAPTIAAEAVTDQVLDSELVLGLKLNGDSRAYPINMLTGPSREIINDTLGGVPIAATW